MHKLIIEPALKRTIGAISGVIANSSFFSHGDILVRYKQTAIGIAWAIERGKLPDGVSPEGCGE